MDSSLYSRLAWVLVAFFATSATLASDGTPDTGNRFPAVGAYYEYFVYLTPGETADVAFAEESCSGSLVAPKVFMTAAHCTAYNYTNDIGVSGYYDRAWVTFDLVATGNDFRCFVAEQGVPYTEYMTADYGCDPATKSVPFPTFRPVAIAGRTDGVPIAHGLTASVLAEGGGSLKRLERVAILQALQRYGGNRLRAARALGIHRSTLRRKMEELGIHP